jgi:hypothetical protein
LLDRHDLATDSTVNNKKKAINTRVKAAGNGAVNHYDDEYKGSFSGLPKQVLLSQRVV